MDGHAQLLHLQRPLAEHMASSVDECLAQGAVRNDENSDHDPCPK
jgi:hypothetical protein